MKLSRRVRLAVSLLFLIVFAAVLRAEQTDPPAAETPDDPATMRAAEKEKAEKAEQQIKEQEQQRILGVLPAFNISYRQDAVSLTPKQKFRLALRTVVDPVTFAGAFLVAGYREVSDDEQGLGWGFPGYMHRVGVSYLDSFDGTMLGNAVLPSLLHQDPRYFRLGHGSFTRRALYSMAATVICKHDDTGRWEPNYSNIGGNIAAGAISNLYYPSVNSGVRQTFANGLIVTAEGAVGSFFDEFWPDVSRRVLHRDPTHGLDAAGTPAEPTHRPVSGY